jgi:hypothetical protein
MEFDVNQVDRGLVLKMLKREQELRYSEEMQLMYDSLSHSIDQEIVEKTIQKQVREEFGFTDSNESIRNYQSIGYLYRDDEEVRQSVNYLRLNIIRDCPIKEGELAPDVSLVNLEGQDCRLQDYLSQSKPLVILAGSLT